MQIRLAQTLGKVVAPLALWLKADSCHKRYRLTKLNGPDGFFRCVCTLTDNPGRISYIIGQKTETDTDAFVAKPYFNVSIKTALLPF